MANNTRSRTPYTIAVLFFFTIGIVIFLGVVIDYITHPSAGPSLPKTTPIMTFTHIPSETPTKTSTITLTPRPTWTFRPSATSTLTPYPTSSTTPTLIRTLSASTPAGINNWYELKPWNLAEQAHTIELLKANTVLTESDDSFRALAFAEGEALIRFPQAVEATNWMWDRGYNFLRISDSLGIEIYSNLIQSAIASGQVRLNDLSSWFSIYENRLTLHFSSLTPQPGELGRGIIELIGEGSAYLWLIEDPLGTRIFPILNDIDYTQPHENAFLYDDINGNGTPEVVIYRRFTPGNTFISIPQIFDLTSSPPVRLPIQEQVPVDFGLEPQTEVNIIIRPQTQNTLKVTNIMLPACPVYVSQEYVWSNDQFLVTPLQYEIKPSANSTAYCATILDVATQHWGPKPSILVAQTMSGFWPPEKDIQGHLYPADALDKVRFQLGILYALNGQPSDATSTLSEIVNAPAMPDSFWVKPAELFLQTYQEGSNLFTACQQTELCNLRDAFQTLVGQINSTSTSQVISYIQAHGVIIRSSGMMDFNLDGRNESWVIIQPKPGAKLEFWILYQAQAQVQAAFVEVYEPGESLPYFHEPAGAIPVIQFQLHKGFVFRYLPDFNVAYIQWVDVEYARPTILRDSFQQVVNDLATGPDLSQIKDRLLEIYNSPRFAGDCIAFRICDQFHYTLALVYDLLGDSGNSIDQYLWVWRNYNKGPYALMSRLKLDYFPLPTYTRTPAPSRTQAPTRTITPTRTATNTATQTITYTPTPSDTPTVTITPTATSTETPLANP